MHLLIIGKVWPEPTSSAAGTRMLQLIRLFKLRGWQVSFACAANKSEYSADLGNAGVDSYTIELNNSSFDNFIGQLQPSAVLFDRFSTEEQFGWRIAEHCRNALRILDMEDLHCLRAARHHAVKEKRDFTRADLVNDIAKRELASIYRCDLSLVISEYEMQLLGEVFRVDKNLLHYLPFMEDPISEEEERHFTPFAERRHFISIGNFLHEPNWDAVLVLKKEIWPLIRKQLPGAELNVYGAYPSYKVTQLNDPEEGFMIRGRAASVKEVMSASRLCLAPLRFGAGLKGKLLDAMRFGTPSITTSIGAEGMHGTMEWSGRIANKTEDFADAAIELYTREDQWLAARQQGVQLHNTFFNKEKHEHVAIERILYLNKRLTEHRLENFTGAMLFHHSLLSTKYMALWIEAKTKKDAV